MGQKKDLYLYQVDYIGSKSVHKILGDDQQFKKTKDSEGTFDQQFN